MRRLLITLCLLLLSLLAACGGPRMVTEQNVAEMDHPLVKSTSGFSLTLSQYYRWMENSGYVARGGTLSPDDGRDYLDSMLIDTLADIKADKLNLRAHRKYLRAFLLRYNGLLEKEYLERAILPDIRIDSQQVADYYAAHSKLYDLPEQVLIHHILISPRAMLNGPESTFYEESPPEVLANAAESLAYYCYDLIVDSGQTFPEVAKEYSHDSDAKTTGGFVGWTVRDTYLPPFDSVAFGTEKGGVSKPYHNKNGWHILWVEDKWKGGVLPLTDSVYQDVESALLTEKLGDRGKAVRDSLSYDLNIRYHDAVLDTNTFKVDDWQWAAILNNEDTIFFYQIKAKEQLFRTIYRVPETDMRMKREMIRSVAEEIRVIQAARDMGIDTIATVAKGERDLRHKYAKQCVEEAMQDPTWVPAESLVTAYYREHLDEYKIDKPLNVQQIVVADSAIGRFVADQARSGVNFLSLARQFYVGEGGTG